MKVKGKSSLRNGKKVIALFAEQSILENNAFIRGILERVQGYDLNFVLYDTDIFQDEWGDHELIDLDLFDAILLSKESSLIRDGEFTSYIYTGMGSKIVEILSNDLSYDYALKLIEEIAAVYNTISVNVQSEEKKTIDISYTEMISKISDLNIIDYADYLCEKFDFRELCVNTNSRSHGRMNNILSIINKELVSGVESKFLTKQVVPDVVGNLGRYSILVSPLYYGNNKQGYYVSTLCAECLNFYKSIQSLLGSMLYSEVVVERAHLIDPLTKLSNRMFFNMRVESLTASKSKKIALMYIDIDQFKKINTRLGHESGDVVLREVANKLKSTYVNSEDIFRLGSDEFLILVSDYKSNKDVMRLAKKIVSDITREFFVSKYEVKLEVNVGISVYPDDGSTPTELLQAADSALVMSKNYGANQYSFYDPLMSEEQNTRIEVENTILDSFDNDNFFIQFQPRVNCQSGLITYFEALVRIKKDGRVLYPDEFLQVAEEMNVISEIDEWVLENACKEINEWNRKGDMGSHISLNMSSRELNDMEIVGKYLKIISRHHLSPSQFSLEVTNKVISDDEHLTIAVLNKFRENGFKVVMDIDGFSFAEMDKIRHFPIDTIKIQKKIIDDLGQNKVSQIIIQSVVLIAKELGYKVVAEGVEDGKQYEFLREVGCDEVQGYYFSKPKYADELVEYRKSSYRFIN